MYYQKAFVKISGKPFFTTRLTDRTGLAFDETEESAPYTFGYLHVPNTVKNREGVTWLLNRIIPHLNTVRECGGDEVELNIAYYHDGQFNCSLTQEEIQLLAEAGGHLVFSAYEDAALVEAYERGDLI